MNTQPVRPGVSSLLVLPGMNGTDELIGGFLAACRPGIDATCVNYPSDRPLGYAQLEGFVRERLPVGRPYLLLGESFSGPIAVSIAAARPTGLCGVVLCATFVRCPSPLLRPMLLLSHIIPGAGTRPGIVHRLALRRIAPPDLRCALSASMARLTAETFWARMRAVLEVDVTAALAQVHAPILYLRARHDRLVPRAASRLVERTLPGVRIVDFDSSHLILQSKPEEAAEAVRRFAQECRMGDAARLP